jgi:hypothetical protein
VEIRQTETGSARLQVAGTVGFEEFPKFAELMSVAEHGENPHFKPGFQFKHGCFGRQFVISTGSCIGGDGASSYPSE